MMEFTKAKEPFLLGFLKLANGTLSHDTFSRLFRQLNAKRFRATFQRFMAKLSKATPNNDRVGWVPRRGCGREGSVLCDPVRAILAAW